MSVSKVITVLFSTPTRVLLVLFFCLPLVFHVSAVDIEGPVTSSISQAEDALVLAYEAVLEAEQAGANVAGLLFQLNVAGENLAKARMLYDGGLFDEAARFTGYSYGNSSYVVVEASELESLAVEKANLRLQVTVIISVAGVGVIACISVAGWVLFKGWYRKRVLKMKPEVVKGGS